MKLDTSSILITGAAGGIGSATARQLGSAGARLLLTDFRAEPLQSLAAKLTADGINVRTVAADISKAGHRQELARASARSQVDTLINIAGINPFGMFASQSDEEIERALSINTLAPLLLCRALLPELTQRDEAHIVNVGSVFGSLGYPGFAVYSASKFAVHGFTEALRRELADTAVHVHYVAPRATRTALSTDRISAMNAELGVATDPPETVALAIQKTLSRSRRETFCGFPERIFRMLNAVAPGVIDSALRKQLKVVKRYASGGSATDAPASDKQVDLKILGVER